jgi:uracil-DNA glycosylase
MTTLDRLLAEIRACRFCAETPADKPLPHAPRPVLRVSPTARLAIVGQAPGTRVHASGVPFSDPSGERLRDWMGVSEQEFYDQRRIAIVPMGFCYPGQDAAGADLPPRRECAPRWRPSLFEHLDRIELMLVVGGYAQRWHLGAEATRGVTATVARWNEILEEGTRRPRCLPLPHPSWRNNAWIKKHPWFEAELVPRLRTEVRAWITGACNVP